MFSKLIHLWSTFHHIFLAAAECIIGSITWYDDVPLCFYPSNQNNWWTNLARDSQTKTWKLLVAELGILLPAILK